MIQLVAAGFMIGIIGSFHCIGMCGPLALSLPLNNNSQTAKFFGALVYNAGRVATYSLLGLLFGLIGKSVAMFGFQQILSVILGVLILLFILPGKRFSKAKFSIPWVNNFFVMLRNMLGKLYLNKNFFSLFLIGLLNGLLPCGLVYMAIAGAIAAGGVLNSIFFMASFGFGTLPVMWAVAFFGNYLAVGVRRRIRTVYPYAMALMACLLIVRGMGLGIPYVSPKVDMAKKEIKSCCHKP